jgi:hypothetical protein
MVSEVIRSDLTAITVLVALMAPVETQAFPADVRTAAVQASTCRTPNRGLVRFYRCDNGRFASGEAAPHRARSASGKRDNSRAW